MHDVACDGAHERVARETGWEKVQLQELKVLETVLRVLCEWAVLR